MKKYLLFLLVPFLGFTQTQIGLDIMGEAINNQFGYSVSMSSDGTIVAVGAHRNSANGFFSGHTRVYKNISGTWIQIGNDIDGEAEEDTSGFSVSLSADGTIVAIGAPRNDENGADSGHVRVYQNISGTWIQIGNDINGQAPNDYFGSSVSLSSDGSTVAVGAPYNNTTGTVAGQVRVYKNIEGNWTLLGNAINAESSNDYFGSSVSLSADATILAVGAHTNNGNGNDSGHVRIFQFVSEQWVQIGNDIDGEMANDQSGLSISLSSDGNSVAIGAVYNSGNGSLSGHVRVFQNNAGTWTQVGNDIDGEAPNDYSGWSVSLSADGSILAVGAIYNNGSGNGSGHVRVFENNAGNWVQIGTDINGEAMGDQSGYSVSLSDDGSIVAIGAINNFGSWGHVRVYSLASLLHLNDFSKSEIIVYPNPVSDIVNIKLPEDLDLKEVKFFNYLGQEILKSKDKNIDISNLHTGTYILEIATNTFTYSQKIIIN